MIYTTNAIESFNSALRKVTDRKAAFPNEMAVMKILYLRTQDVVKKWTMPYPNWGLFAVSLICCGGMAGIRKFYANVYTIGLTRSSRQINWADTVISFWIWRYTVAIDIGRLFDLTMW